MCVFVYVWEREGGLKCHIWLSIWVNKTDHLKHEDMMQWAEENIVNGVKINQYSLNTIY